ncbi:MAG: putative dTDP-4-deoxyrhamnose 3,5 epimerase [Gammaproteobacteria bacterium]|jgi:dTDP-4-dehydrorhamnose 3,5-epimerase|nr:putative dTDP-4-deoxyrhamnose 3,5 epimerase [Gammaproteobacteria bacterium]
MPFEFTKLALPEVILIKPEVFYDDRGFFMESFKTSEFSKHGIPTHFSQDNHSKSNKSVLRGLHFQLNPKAQGKLVRVIRGRIFDVVVDIRKGSPNYGKWLGLELSEHNKHILWIPAGFAHGVAFLEDNTELLYKATEEYSKQHERSILWNDPELGINWPITKPILSEKDEQAAVLKEVENNNFYLP